VQFTAKLADVEIIDEHVRRVELQSVWMNIADTRSLGDSLLQMLGKDDGGFDAWCDKVGNNWIDAPLYSSGGSQIPESGKFCGFQILNTFNNEQPWTINFVITGR
jgi:hypothetical protein